MRCWLHDNVAVGCLEPSGYSFVDGRTIPNVAVIPQDVLCWTPPTLRQLQVWVRSHAIGELKIAAAAIFSEAGVVVMG